MKIDIVQISFFHQNIRELLTWLEDHTGLEYKITGLHREDGGIHDTIPLRAIDLLMRDKSMGKAIEKLINDRFEYDPERPGKFNCAWYHNSGDGWHLHIQVHHNTQLRKPSK